MQIGINLKDFFNPRISKLKNISIFKIYFALKQNRFFSVSKNNVPLQPLKKKNKQLNKKL